LASFSGPIGRGLRDLELEMEATMAEDIHRRSDGSIDIDFYRVRGAELRRQAIRDGHALKFAAASAVVMTAAVGFATVIPSTSMLGGRLVAALSHTHVTR
jgi:hypothetical protein